MHLPYKAYSNFLRIANQRFSQELTSHEDLINAILKDFQNCQPAMRAFPCMVLLDFSQLKYLAIGSSVQQMLGYSSQYLMDGGLNFT